MAVRIARGTTGTVRCYYQAGAQVLIGNDDTFDLPSAGFNGAGGSWPNGTENPSVPGWKAQWAAVPELAAPNIYEDYIDVQVTVPADALPGDYAVVVCSQSTNPHTPIADYDDLVFVDGYGGGFEVICVKIRITKQAVSTD